MDGNENDNSDMGYDNKVFIIETSEVEIIDSKPPGEFKSTAKFQDITRYLDNQDNCIHKRTTKQDEIFLQNTNKRKCGIFGKMKEKFGLSSNCSVFLDQIVAIILHIPFFLAIFLKSVYVKCVQKHKLKSLGTAAAVEVKVVDFCNYQRYWGPEDVNSDEDIQLYQKKIQETLCKCTSRDMSDRNWIEFQKELKHLVTNAFLNRLKACVNAIEAEDLHGDSKVIAGVLALTQYVVQESNYKVLNFVLMNDSISTQLGIDIMSYVMLDKELSAVHMAIINEQMMLLRHIFKCVETDNFRYKVANKATQSIYLKSLFPASEYPLNLAVWIGNAEVITFLVNNGAEMCMQDTQGYNCFHVAALLAKDQPDKALKIFDVLLELIPMWIEKSETCASLRSMCPSVRNIAALFIIFKSKTKSQLTVLTMAAAVGSKKLLYKILSIKHIYKQSSDKMGIKSMACYDVAEIDPLLSSPSTKLYHQEETKTDDNRPTVLELLAFRYDELSLTCIHHPMISEIGRLKGEIYKTFVIVFMCIHVTFMIIYTTGAYVYICPHLINNNTDDMSDTNITDYDYNIGDTEINMTSYPMLLGHGGDKMAPHPPPSYIPGQRFRLIWIDYVISVVATFYLLYFCVCANAVHKVSRRCQLTGMDEVWKYNSLQIQTLLLFSLSVYIYLILKISSSTNESIALSISFLIGWMHCIMYTRIFKSLGFFTIMLHRILISDVLRFLFVICIICLSYTMATMVIYSTEYGDNEDGENDFHKKPWYIMFDFFRLGLDIADYTRLLQSHYEWLATALYISFVVLCNILLFNLLIAAMNKRYGNIGKNEQLQWERARLADIIILEWIAPYCLKKRYKEIYKRQRMKISIDYDINFEYEQYLLDAHDTEADTYI